MSGGAEESVLCPPRQKPIDDGVVAAAGVVAGQFRSVFPRNEIDILFLKEIRDRTGYLRNGISVVYLIDCPVWPAHSQPASQCLWAHSGHSVSLEDAPDRSNGGAPSLSLSIYII